MFSEVVSVEISDETIGYATVDVRESFHTNNTNNLKSYSRTYIRDRRKEEYIKRSTKRHPHVRRSEIYK